MHCPNCGNQIAENTRFCPHCGGNVSGDPNAAPPIIQGEVGLVEAPTYLVWSILVTVLCCLPGGIVAIVYSATAMSKNGVGDYAGAQAAAKSAKTWILVSVGCAVVLWILYVGFMVLMTMAGAAGAAGQGGGGFGP